MYLTLAQVRELGDLPIHPTHDDVANVLFGETHRPKYWYEDREPTPEELYTEAQRQLEHWWDVPVDLPVDMADVAYWAANNWQEA
uniref:Uncharacterized protein n=1 Tax=viral metagenome TaxID=1070528 RepID=A0A6C0BNS1_9ZZZZ